MTQRHPAGRLQVRLKDALIRHLKPVVRRIRPQKSDAFQLEATIPAAGSELSFALFQSLGVELVTGHRVTRCDNGAVFDMLVDELARARSSIHIVMYIWERGRASERLLAVLLERARAGVVCRILVDAFGSPDFDEELMPQLTEAGCEVRIFRPLFGNEKLARNHRKIVICDGQLAFTGGFGVRDEWLGDGVHEEGWRDANVRVTGPAVVQAQLAFAENWQEAGGGLLPRSAFPTPLADGPSAAAFVSSTGAVVSRAERLTQLVIAAAQRRIWISNAYFVPTRGIVHLLCAKARAGLDVRILTPGKKSDSKTAFFARRMDDDEMLACGVRVWEYLPSMMHAKTMLVDEQLALVGSINLEPLSLGTLEDAALLVEDRAFAAELAQAFEGDLVHARELGR